MSKVGADLVRVAARAQCRSSQDQGCAADVRQGQPSRLAPLTRANICDRLSSATDTPRSARQQTLK